MQIGGHEFDTANRCYIMGILNMTPDSFSDGGKWNTPEAALIRVGEMLSEGADVIDVGGESTRPGYVMISEEEETDRIIPVIEAIKKRFDVPVSIDTYKSAVAEAAIQAGADLINDIWGFKYDPQMAYVAARSGVACCLMHNRGNTDYSCFMSDMLVDLGASVELARKAGVDGDKIILDPGIGFAKTYEMNLEAINKVDMLKLLGYPILLGTSRKSVVGTALGLPADERGEGSLATAVIGVMRGCAFIRAHDVKGTKRAVMMTEAVLGKNVKSAENG